MPCYVPLRDPIINGAQKYENHPSIALIQKNIRYMHIFEFKPIRYAIIQGRREGIPAEGA